MYFFRVLTRVVIPVWSVVFVADAARVKKPKYQNPYYNRANYEVPASEEQGQDFSKIPGEPGVDYPLFHSVPETNFNCASVPHVPGIYANIETGCQAYHVCHDGREGHQGASFLCSNGTLFNQEEFTCDWWYKVDCKQAPSLYRLNADEKTNPFVSKQKSEEELDDYKSTPQSYKSTPNYYQSPSPYYKPTPKPYYQPAVPLPYYQGDY